jgi:predicted RND superfamily exporter protein
MIILSENRDKGATMTTKKGKNYFLAATFLFGGVAVFICVAVFVGFKTNFDDIFLPIFFVCSCFVSAVLLCASFKLDQKIKEEEPVAYPVGRLAENLNRPN